MAVPQRMLESPHEARYPDSPVITDSFASPELRGGASAFLNHDVYPAPHSSFSGRPSIPTITQLLADGKKEDHEKSCALVLRHAVQWSVERGDVELVVWLAGLTGRWASVLDSEVSTLEDEEGWGLIGMAVIASCGRQDKEEIVRSAVGRWGVDCGPREGRDRTGWTPLHLAALISSPPLISFLLTRGASPGDTTNRGLTPLDLVAGIPDRQHISSLLQQASNQGTSALRPVRTTLTEGRQRLLRRRRHRAERESVKGDERARRAKRDMEREKWVRETVDVVGVDADVLFAKSSGGSRASKDSGIELREDSDSDDSEMEADLSPIYEELAFLPENLPTIFNTILSSYQPVCQPMSRRALPANMLYLYARFAYKRCSETWLEELLEGAVDRIESDVYKNLEDLSYLAFWAHNTTLLLYLLVSDDDLRVVCDELGLLGMVEELINAIHVFVIRVAERRIDQVLDGGILDYETLEDFDDVRFEGEWALFRTFGTKKQRASIIPKASQVFSDAVNAATTENGSPGSIFNSLRGKSPFKPPPPSPKRPDSDMPPPPLPTSINTQSPSSVTDILTGVLVVLHIYDVNPAITIQAFSQVFFWIAAELFNRILSRRKYLCRSKAIQIRMNITALDDWVRLHGLPAKTAGQHFEPVLQLLQWLQTQSNIHAFDHLIGTVQGLKRLNPLQMRRAVREYKFEVNEGRMDEECVVYMGQIQKDWENRRVRSSVKALKAEQGGEGKDIGMPGTPVDALFDGSAILADFVPSSGPECFGELLDSRFMLPFQLPDNPAYLVATPTPDAIYSNISTSSPFLSDSRTASRTSFSPSRPFEFVLPPRKQLKELPSGFFAWLKVQEVGRRPSLIPRKPSAARSPLMNGGAIAAKPLATPDAVSPVAIELGAIILPPRASSRPLPEAVPTVQPTSVNPLLPSPGLQSPPSLDRFRDPAQIPFRTVDPPAPNFRPDSYELRIRQAVNSMHDVPESSAPPTRELKTRPSLDFIRKITSPTRSSVPLPSQISEEYNGNYNGPSTPTSPSSSIRPLPVMSPQSMTSSQSSDSSKKKWWKIGRKEGSGDSEQSDGGRMRRKASSNTLGKGPMSPGTPDGTRRSGFY